MAELKASALMDLILFTEEHGGTLLHHKQYGVLMQLAKKEHDTLQSELDATKERLKVACHIKADSAEEFDWAVLDKALELDRLNERLENQEAYIDEQLGGWKSRSKISRLETELSTLKQSVKDAVEEIGDMDVTGEEPYRVREDVLKILRSHGLLKEEK